MNNDIFNVDLTRTLPPALKKDPSVCALSQMLAKELQETAELICRNIIYARIDELPEKILDILAYDMHIDWYSYEYPLKIKREMIKTSIKVHKKMGTRYAVESVLQSLHPESRIEEWFEYGGSHHCFRLVINADNKEYEIDLDKIIRSINIYKRLSAHLESVILERRKRRKIYVLPVKEVFVQRKIKINQFTKTVNRNVGITVGNAVLSYVSLTVRKG